MAVGSCVRRWQWPQPEKQALEVRWAGVAEGGSWLTSQVENQEWCNSTIWRRSPGDDGP